MTLPALSNGPLTAPPHDETSRYIFGTGEIAGLVRAFDWASTPLGPISTWREPLLTSVNLLLSSRHPMFLWWGADLIQFYNDAYRPSLGIGKHPSALGQAARECWKEIWEEYILPRIDLVMREGKATWYVNQVVPILRNGKFEEVYWTWSDSPVRDAEGNVVGILVTCSETTDRVLAERELHRSRERLQLALEAADLGTWSYDPNGQTFTADAAMQRIFGASRPTGDLDFWQQLLHPDDRRAAREAFADALAGLRPYNIEYRILHPGGVRWIRSKAKVLSLDGETKGMFAVVEDITERKLAEIELQTRARDLRESQRIGKMGSWHLVLSTGELTWSEEVYRLMERDPALPPTTPEENASLFQDDSLERLHQAVQSCIETRQPYELDTSLRLASGNLLWLATRGEPVLDASGELVALRGTVRDITDRKLVEEALRSSEQRLQLAIESANLGTWSYDASSDLSTGDAAMQRIFGSPQAAGDFDYWIQFVHPDDREAVAADFRAAVSGGAAYESEYRIVRPADGEIRWIRSRGRILREPDRPLRMVVIVEDVTDRKRTEEALLRNEKLAAVGRLASSIAHEINNPLESVTNLLYLAKTTVHTPDAQEYLSIAEHELRRASAITTTTLRFHRQSTRPAEVSCDELIEGVLGIHRSRIKNAGIGLEMRQRAARPVLCSDGEIRQVLSNLVGNATDAMQTEGGRLLIRSREAHDWTTGRAGVVVTVADTGPGMSRATVAHAFDAFYTTKGASGTGLGLWISKEIVERHQGRLSVRSSQRPGRTGTVFTLFLPHPSATA